MAGRREVIDERAQPNDIDEREGEGNRIGQWFDGV
jgi:hypothetical protein